MRFYVKRQTEFGSRNWGVYRTDTRELVEGGFFARDAAVDCAAEYETLGDA